MNRKQAASALWPRTPQRVLCVGLARDVAAGLARQVAHVSAVFPHCSTPRWFVVESDSADDTPQILQRLAAEQPHFRYVSLGALKKQIPHRTSRLAFCRNLYLQEIRENPAYADVELVAMMDLDGTTSHLTRTGIASCFRRTPDWDVCTANCDAPYYDVWALRHPLWSPEDCWKRLEFFEQFGLRRAMLYETLVGALMLRIPRSADWIEVDSGFNGFALYRRAILQHGRYEGKTEDESDVCEHVPFHLELKRAGARIYINPQLIASGYRSSVRYPVSP